MIGEPLLVLLSVLAAAGPVQAIDGEDLTPPPIAQKMGPAYYSGAILPTPQEAEYRDDVLELVDGPAGKWRCRIDIDCEGPAAPLARRLIEARIGKYSALFPALPERPTGKAPKRVVFTTLSDKRCQQQLRRRRLKTKASRLKPQGYLLEMGPEGVFCAARDDAGLVNGVASFLQLVHVCDDRLVVQCASVRDWPIFQIRYTSEYHLPGPDFFDWMMLNKINGFAACYPGMRWQELSESKRAGLKAIGEYVRRYRTMHFLVEFHIGGRRNRPVDCGNAEDVNRLLQTIRETMELSHAQHVMICYDDVKPELQPEEKKLFANPAEAHGAVMEKVYGTVKSIDPNTVVSFCSPNYQGLQHKRWWVTNPELPNVLKYMEHLRAWKNRDVRIVWTGPVTESRRITLKDIAAYKKLVGADRLLFYWDNTWHYHQPLRNFHAKYYPGFVNYCADKTSYINVNGVRPIGRFFSVTANDYYWNPDAFDPKRSRRHAVAQFMGPQAVFATESFYQLRGDDYFVFFARDVDLDELKSAIERIERTSLNKELNDCCRATHKQIVDRRKSKKK